MIKTVILAILITQIAGQAKIVKKQENKQIECKITEESKKDCARYDRVPVCVKLGNDWTYRCDKRVK